MKLSKDYFIEGKILKKGIEVEIQGVKGKAYLEEGQVMSLSSFKDNDINNCETEEEKKAFTVYQSLMRAAYTIQEEITFLAESTRENPFRGKMSDGEIFLRETFDDLLKVSEKHKDEFL